MEYGYFDKIHADVVLSVGQNCLPAIYLRNFSLRKEASLLDWLGRYSLESVLELFRKDFKDFFSEVEVLGQVNLKELDVKDVKNNVCSKHYFNSNQDIAIQAKEFNALSIKRWSRIKEKIKRSQNIVFISFSNESFENCENFLKECAVLFGIEKIYRFIQIFNDVSKKEFELEIQSRYFNDKMSIVRYIGNNNFSNEERLVGNEFSWGEVMKNIVLKNDLNYNHLSGSAARVQKHLRYKLGQVMILNSKNILGYMKMPFLFFCVYVAHLQELKTYRHQITKNPKLILLPLDTYMDYGSALNEMQSLSYRLGNALIKGIMGGGYIKMWFEIRKLKKSLKL